MAGGQLVEGGWKLKPLQKLIVMSQAYQQSSDYRADAASVDGGSRLLWRFPPQRLSAEEIRDTMLFTAGKLDERMGGPGFRLYEYTRDNVATYTPLESFGPETYRRSVYHQNARSSRIDLLSDFDAPDCAFSASPPRADHHAVPGPRADESSVSLSRWPRRLPNARQPHHLARIPQRKSLTSLS